MSQTVAVVGATGAVGREFLRVFEQRQFPLGRLRLLASQRSAGCKIAFRGEQIPVEELGPNSFSGIDLALFAAGSDISRKYAPLAVRAGAVVIDNSSAFRMDSDCPLVVPEVNPEALKRHQGIIANPNCSTIIMVLVVWPLYQANRVRRLVVSTYQAASGAGQRAMDELVAQTRQVLDGQPPTIEAFPFRCAFNLFSHDSPMGDNGYNEEENKLIDETRKLFGDPGILISPTCVRVPVLRVHSESINLTFERPITVDRAREILQQAPGVKVVDDRCKGLFPMPVDADGVDDVLVGRIRRDLSQADGCRIELFICGDQLRKGAALNAVQIAEMLL